MTKQGSWAKYKKLVKRPDQIKGRAMLRKAIDDAVKALNIIWVSDYQTEKEAVGNDIKGKYSHAAYYIFKYLIETKEFDPLAKAHGYIIHMLHQREDGRWILTDNNYNGNSINRVGGFLKHIGNFLEDLTKEVTE